MSTSRERALENEIAVLRARIATLERDRSCACKAAVAAMRNGNGGYCPACTRKVKEYARGMTSGMARALLEMVRASETELLRGQTPPWLHVPDLLKKKNIAEKHVAHLANWGLIEALDILRPDGSPNTGNWRVLPLGVEFAMGRVKVPRKPIIFNTGLLGFVDENDRISIADALGDKFDYRELMAPFERVPPGAQPGTFPSTVLAEKPVVEEDSDHDA